MLNAEIALGGFNDRGSSVLIEDEGPLGRANFHHTNIVVRTTVRTRRTTDAGEIVDQDIPRFFIPSNGTRRTTNHAHGVSAMHARIGKHEISV